MNLVHHAMKVYQNRGVLAVLVGAWIFTLQHSPVAPYLESILGERRTEQLVALPEVGYWPRITSPRSFNEKCMHRKLFDDDDRYPIVSDKWAVRRYVERKVGSTILNDVYCVTDDPEKIPFESLPEQFVVKSTHGSGQNVIVSGEEEIRIDEVKSECDEWLDSEFGTETGEWWYGEIEPQLVVEEYISVPDRRVPLDYKFFVFDGRVEYVHVDFGRFSRHTRRFYDRQWDSQEFTYKYPIGPDIEAPPDYDEMIDIAERIAEDFDFARVDLYNPTDGEIVFGEITLAPEAGQGRFVPKDRDFALGELWPTRS